MTDDQRIEDSQEKLDADDEDVEAHKRRLAEEPAAEEDDDVEAHRRRS